MIVKYKEFITSLQNKFPGSADISKEGKEGLLSFSRDLESSYEKCMIRHNIPATDPLPSKHRGGVIKDVAAGKYNYIPGIKKGGCHNTLIVAALGSSGSQDGFNRKMIDVVDCWISCKNRITVIITKDWSSEHFSRWLEVIETHKRENKAEVYIVEYTDHTHSCTLKYS